MSPLLAAAATLAVACTSAHAQILPHDELRSRQDRMSADYRQLHGHPELGREEIWTSDYVRARLRELGIVDVRTLPNLPTAVIAVIATGRAGPVTAFRAELDARPGRERTDRDYASPTDRMHSCGHDAHAAILLGFAEVIARRQDRLRGTVVFVFQPAEETPGGADDIVDSGVLQNLGVNRLFALHVAPTVPVGEVSFSPGPVMASSTYFTVTLTGHGGHAASPQTSSDLPLTMSRAIAAVSDFPARRLDILSRPTLVSVTSASTGSLDAANVLPAAAVFSGTIRTFEDTALGSASQPSIRAIFEAALRQAVTGFDVEARVDWRGGSPPTTNNDELASEVEQTLRESHAATVTSAGRFMFAEDFAYYTPHFKSLYLGLGIARDGLGGRPVHSPEFTIHVDALGVGLRVLTSIAEHYNSRR